MAYIGIDIGGTKCAVSLGECEDGNIRVLAREETPTLRSPQETLQKVSAAVKRYQQQAPIVSAGISCGGPLDSRKGIIVRPPNLFGWEGFPIVEYIKEQFGLSAKLQNDANACAVAEWRFGAGRGVNNMVFLTFGTGLGSGLILDGRLYVGANDNAGEAGHIRLAKRGPIGYGKYGSFEGFCSGGGISRLAVEMAQRRRKMPACIENMGGVDHVTTKALCQAAKNGDPFAKAVLEKSGEMLGKGLSMIVDMLNPERIVIGGVFMRASALLIPSMRKQLEKEALQESLSVCEIVPAQLSENVGDIAALAIAEGVDAH